MENLQTRHRKAMLIMPVMVIPFLTLGFWALGGGRGSSPRKTARTGLNLQLPEAHPNDKKEEGKLAFYEQAQRDSLARREAMKKDPFLQQSFMAEGSYGLDSGTDAYIEQAGFPYKPTDPNETMVYQKLGELNRQLSRKDPQPPLPQEPEFNRDQDQQLQTVQDHYDPSSVPDPEMQQLNSLMDKVLRVRQAQQAQQDRSQKTAEGTEEKDSAFPVNRLRQATINCWDSGGSGALFLGLDNEPSPDAGNSIFAEVDHEQKVISGSEIRLRLLEDEYVHGHLVPAGSFVFAKTSISSNRLLAEVNSIRCGNSIFPVQLEVYDLDGLKGISVPGSVSTDVLKQTSQNSVQALDAGSLDPSLKAQVTSAGIRTAKSLITQRAHVLKVWLKDGYRLLLKNKIENL